MKESFRVRLLDRLLTWFGIFAPPALISIGGIVIAFSMRSTSSSFFRAKFDRWVDIAAFSPFVAAILLVMFMYIRYRGIFITRYALTADGVWFLERAEWGIRTELAKSVQPWTDISAIRINDQGKIRVIFNSGDQIEGKYRVEKPEQFQAAARKRLEATRSSMPSRSVKTIKGGWDVFISHAWEDKVPFVRDLAAALTSEGLRVWYDEYSLRVGDSLRRSIDQGLSQSKYGVVVVSPRFLAKEWPQKELDGLVAREIDSRRVILPVWHGLGVDVIRQYSPTLADRVATSSDKGLNIVVEDLLNAMQ